MDHETTFLHGRSVHASGEEQSFETGEATIHDGDDGSDDWDLPLGTELGRYVLLDRLGAGAMGLVYSAYDAQLDRKIAIKIVKAHRVRNESGASGAARLMREAQALARLSHPNVVPIYDVGVLGDRVWVALEYVEGWTVRQWLDRRPRHWRDILAVFVQAGRGLLAAHAAQLVHRDFKPDNVLVDRSGRARVTDFGLARVDNSLESVASSPIDSHDGLSESLTRTGSVMGTPGYMAPEQHFGRPAEARSDQFAFCVALFEAVYGVRPFAGKTIREVAHAKWTGTMRDPKDFARRPTGIPAALDAAIRRGLAGEADRRWPTMGALVDELERILQRPRTRLRIAALGVLAIVGAAWAWQSRPRECAAGLERLQGIWDDTRAAELGDAFAGAGTPAADDAWTTTREGLDAYAADWATAYDAACTARAEQTEVVRDAAMLCLQRRRGQLRAAVDALAQGDRSTVHRAADVVEGLDPIGPCLGAGTRQLAVPDDPELATKVESTREHIANAVARRDAGQYATGSELARAAAREAGELGFAPLQIEADLVLGVSLGKTDLFDEGEARLVDAFHGAREQGMDEIALDAAIHLVFLVGVHHERWADGLEWVRHGEAMQERLPAEDPQRRARLLENRSLLFTDIGRFDDAEAGYREALALRKELGSSERAIAMLHNNYGNMLASRRKYAQALVEHTSALELRIARLGRQHPDVAMSMINIARIYMEQYRYGEGLEQLDKADPIIAAALGEDSSMMATALNMRGIALLRGGDSKAARPVFERSLAIRTRLYGPDHVEVGEAWNVIGGTWLEEWELDRAEAALRRAEAIFEVYGPSARVSMLRVRANLGTVAGRRGHHAEAERRHREVLGALGQALGEDNPELCASLRPLGIALLEQNKPAEALPFIERAQTLQRIADNDAEALEWLEFLRLRAEFQLGRDRAHALVQMRRIADRMRTRSDYTAESRRADEWLAEQPA